MAWTFLALAGIAEIFWVISLKQSEGFTRLWPSLAVLACSLFSFGCLGLSLRGIPLGTAYAIWGGIGAIGAAAIGILWYGEDASPIRIGLLALIAAGMIGLKLVSPPS